MDYAYFNKRKLFLAGIRKTLEKCNLKFHDNQMYRDFSVHYFKCDERKPVIVLKTPFSDELSIRIIPVLSQETLKLVQLKNSKNNVRPLSWQTELKAKKEKGNLFLAFSL